MHERDIEVLPVSDAINIRKGKFLVKYGLSDNLLYANCVNNCNEIVLFTVSDFSSVSSVLL